MKMSTLPLSNTKYQSVPNITNLASVLELHPLGKAWFIENFDKLALLDTYAFEWTSETRRKVIRELLKAGAEEEVIKSIIRPEIEEGQVLQKKKMWMEMAGK